MVSNVKVEEIDLHSKFRRKTNCSFDIMLYELSPIPSLEMLPVK